MFKKRFYTLLIFATFLRF